MTFPSSHLSGTILSLLSLLRFLQSSTEATPGLSTPLKKLERLFDDSLISRLCLAFMGRTWRLVHSLGTLILNIIHQLKGPLVLQEKLYMRGIKNKFFARTRVH
ncbi:uncharacterized protein LOC110715392 isoform X2 [Chenopodium quinoa]|uniref:uncharacterized protein LOC110715392 isoform X2 n=1 Tax=Chenopodium quinoa TaxID=63459 RepID=UPI000B776B6B|nr:uncharacterized protein LOC110715392 isoform X2 [Chenopodium quinoa]